MERLTTVSIYQKKKKGPSKRSPVWYMTWRDATGRQHSRTAATRDEEIAKRKAKALEREIALAPYGQVLKPIDRQRTWSVTVDEFCAARGKLRKESIEAYRNCGKAFQLVVGDVPLVSVNSGMLERYVNARIESCANATVNKELRHIRTILRWSHDRGYVREKVSFTKLFVREDFRLPITVPTKTFQAISKALDDQKLVFSRQSADWWKAFLRTLHWTGCRRGELLLLRWNSIDLEKRELTVWATTSKGRQDRILPLSESLIARLRSWQTASELGQPSDLVFPWVNGTRQLYDDFKSIQTAAGVKHHRFKDYRSSRACALIDAGESTLVVKEWLGHSTVATTEKFYASARKRLATAATRLEEVECVTISATT